MPRRDPFERSRLHSRTETRRIEAYQTTGSDGEAARTLQLAHNTFSLWRIRRGLPTKHPKPGNPVLSKPEQARRLAAYHAHASDGEAASALRMSRPAFRSWRNLHGLSAKQTRPPIIGAAEERRRIRAYHECDSDQDAAARLCIGVPGFKTWRQGRGLPGKGAGGPIVQHAEDARRRATYKNTPNDKEAAQRLDMTPSGFQRWRSKAGLPAKTKNGGMRLTPREQARRLRAYLHGGSDEQTARRLGLCLATYRLWRQAQSLPAHRRPLTAHL